ncbi:30S ribosomal protein S8e [Candidatus Woesearchaeota archaeon]|nr:30S ribosomal protein S8e [Candidatus Woesearchaeota archaeon]
MAIAQYRSKRKVSGGRYVSSFKKKLRYLGRLPTLTKMDKLTKKSLRTTGGHKKTFLLTADTANVFDPKTKKHAQLKIETITANPANQNYVRRNIMTKGAIIKTEKGPARITSRPGQEGMINAVLLQEKEGK